MEGLPSNSQHVSLLPWAAAPLKAELENWGRPVAEICLITSHMWNLDNASKSQSDFCLSLIIWIWYTGFHLQLQKSGGGERMGVLYKSCWFCICHAVTTHFTCHCLCVSEPKQKVRWRQLYRRRKILFWTIHKQVYFWKLFQNQVELLKFTWLLLRRAEFMTTTLYSDCQTNYKSTDCQQTYWLLTNLHPHHYSVFT